MPVSFRSVGSVTPSRHDERCAGLFLQCDILNSLHPLHLALLHRFVKFLRIDVFIEHLAVHGEGGHDGDDAKY